MAIGSLSLQTSVAHFLKGPDGTDDLAIAKRHFIPSPVLHGHRIRDSIREIFRIVAARVPALRLSVLCIAGSATRVIYAVRTTYLQNASELM